MPTITKTIGASGDYTSLSSAASAFNGGSVSGASASDDIVFQLVDNSVYDGSFEITGNTGSYASCTLTSHSSVRHTGTPGTGARIAKSTNMAANTGMVRCADTTINFAVTWLEIGGGAGTTNRLIGKTTDATSTTFTVQNCILHGNGATTTGNNFAIYSDACNHIFTNNVIYDITSSATGGAGVFAIGWKANASCVSHVDNNSVYNLVNTNGTGKVTGFASQAGATLASFSGHTCENNIIIGVSGTSSGAKVCYDFPGSPGGTINYNAASDTSTIGANSLNSRVASTEFRNAASGDLRLASGATCFQAGVDLVTTPSGVEIDIEGRNRDTEGDTWSMGAGQTTDAPVNSIAMTAPVDYQLYQRASGTASVTISGTYTGTPATIEYSTDGSTWDTLDGSPTGGTFSQAVSIAEGQYTVSVRFSDDTGTTDSAAFVGVGDAFIVAGQSNAEGRLDNAQSYTHASLKARAFDETDTAWRDCTDPTDDSTANGSVWPLLATLAMASESVPVGFVTVSEGGTGLVDAEWDSQAPGLKYTNAVTRINACPVNGFAAMLWDQGEADANTDPQTSQASYNSHLDALAANLQTDTGRTFPTITTLVGYSNDTSPAGSSLDNVRKAQIEAWGDNASIYPGPNSITRGQLHWETDAEAAFLAGLWWLAIEDALYGGSNGRGPRVSTATSVGGTSTLTITFDRDLNTADSIYTAAAWSVDNDDGASRTVNSVARTGTRTVQLTLSGALDGTSPTVTFASVNTAAGATVPRTTDISLPATIHSVSTVAIPAEPIYQQAVTVTAPDTTAPVIASASVNTAGDTLTLTFTEADSPPMLPSSGATGVTMTSSTSVAITVSNGTRTADTTYTFPLSRTIYDNETLLVAYAQSTGNITDSATSPNEVPDTSNFAVTNGSTQTPSITVTDPDSTDRRIVGTAENITWTSAGIVGNVDILLSKDNGSTFPITIVASTANDGTYSWTPEAAHVSAQAVIRIRDSATGIYHDESAAFIVATTNPGSATDTAEWALLRQLAIDAGLELITP